MNRLLLLMVLGIIVVVGLTIYWFTGRETVSETSARSPEATEEYHPVEKDTLQSETLSPSPQVDTVPEEETSKPASVNRQKFESEEETLDTEDSLMIEVEPEEE